MEESADLKPSLPRIDPLGPMRRLYELQRPGPAVLAGTAGAVAGAAAWACVLGFGGVRATLVGLAVGLIVGIPVRVAGRGVEFKFGLIGGGLAVLAAFVGNFVGFAILKSRALNMPVAEALFGFSSAELRGIAVNSLEPLSLLFCLMAFATGFGSSVRMVRAGELGKAALAGSPVLSSFVQDPMRIPGAAASPTLPKSEAPPAERTPVLKKRLPLRHRKEEEKP